MAQGQGRQQQSTAYQQGTGSGEEAPEKIMCGKYEKEIPRGERCYIWLGFGQKPDEHFHLACANFVPTAPEPPTPAIDFPTIIADGLLTVMRDRTQINDVNKQLTAWAEKLPRDKTRAEKIQQLREHMNTIKQYAEAVYSHMMNYSF